LKSKNRYFNLTKFENNKCHEWTNLCGFMNGQSIVDFQKSSRFKNISFYSKFRCEAKHVQLLTSKGIIA
jgi:hypothetical protein